ncbi:predicted protein, partial [Naegleria gruberi]
MCILKKYLFRMDKFLFNEVNRLANTKLLGVATQQNITRLDYLHNFLTAISYCAPPLEKEDGFIGIKKQKTIITWFFFFNCGHLKDERAAERFVLYCLWKSIKDKQKATTIDDSFIINNDLSPTGTNGDDSPITETPKRKHDNRQPSSIKKLESYLLQSEDCDLFLTNIPENLKQYAKGIILSSDWSFFHRVLAVWRIVNEDDTILNKYGKQHLLRYATKFMNDDDEDISNTKKEFYILRQIVYLITDPPSQSLFKITLESFGETVKERGLIHRLYDGADERSKVLQIENQYYINAKLMSSEYARMVLECMKKYNYHFKNSSLFSDKSLLQDLFYNDPFNNESIVSNNLIYDTSLDDGRSISNNLNSGSNLPLQYYCTIIHPGHRDGDFEKYNEVKNKLQSVSPQFEFNYIYVAQWIGDTNTFANFYLFFKPSIKQLYTMLKISCSEWEKKYGSCYRGIKD